jgi:hypothetical protein
MIDLLYIIELAMMPMIDPPCHMHITHNNQQHDSTTATMMVFSMHRLTVGLGTGAFLVRSQPHARHNKCTDRSRSRRNPTITRNDTIESSVNVNLYATGIVTWMTGGKNDNKLLGSMTTNLINRKRPPIVIYTFEQRHI